MRLPLVLLLLLTLAAPAEAARPTPFGFLGATAGPPVVERQVAAASELPRMARAGVETLRLPLYWRNVQPDPVAPLTLASVEPVVVAAAKARIEVLPVVLGTPVWARTAPDDITAPPRDPADLGRFLQALIARYGPQGSLWRDQPGLPRVPIRAWQVWNEPDNRFFLQRGQFPDGYVAMLRAAHTAIKASDPGAQVVMAGLATAEPTWKAIARVHRAGAEGHFDVVAVHPFTRRPSDVARLVGLARKRLRGLGEARTPIWATEVTWPASRGKVRTSYGFETDARTQARNLREALTDLARRRRSLGLGSVFWETWITDYTSRTNPFDHSGLRRHRRGRTSDRPGLVAFRDVARRLQGCAKRRSARDC